jgi:hypothetical protein
MIRDPFKIVKTNLPVKRLQTLALGTGPGGASTPFGFFLIVD